VPRALFFLAAALLLSGCAGAPQSATPSAMPSPNGRLLNSHECVMGRFNASGVESWMVGCPVQLGSWPLQPSGVMTVDVPAFSTGLLVNVSIRTASAGSASIKLVAANHTGRADLVGPVSLSDGNVAFPAASATQHLSYEMDVCRERTATFAIEASGAYPGGTVSLSAYVLNASLVAHAGPDPVATMNATCRGNWGPSSRASAATAIARDQELVARPRKSSAGDLE
jgi:hypothetical protein